MASKVIGRLEEKKLLGEIMLSTEAELIAVYGSRRVGKTFLIRNILEKEIIFQYSGIRNATLYQQLENFTGTLTIATKSAAPLAKPEGWTAAFTSLISYTSPQIKRQKKVIFFDEFPWINSPTRIG